MRAIRHRCTVVHRGHARESGLLGYFVGDEVVNRVASDEFNRNGQWYGWLKVYAPTLLLGTLPWTPALLRLGAAPARRRAAGGETRNGAWTNVNGCSHAVAAAAAAGVLPVAFAHAAVPAAAVRPHWRCWSRCSASAKAAAWRTDCARSRHGPRCCWVASGRRVLVHAQGCGWNGKGDRARAPGPIGEVYFVEDMARYGCTWNSARRWRSCRCSRNRMRRGSTRSTTTTSRMRCPGEGGRGLDRQAGVVAARRRASSNSATARWRRGTPYYGRVIFRVVPRAVAEPMPTRPVGENLCPKCEVEATAIRFVVVLDDFSFGRVRPSVAHLRHRRDLSELQLLVSGNLLCRSPCFSAKHFSSNSIPSMWSGITSRKIRRSMPRNDRRISKSSRSADQRRRTGIAFAGKRAISISPSRIGAPGSGAQAIAVMVSHVAGNVPSPRRSGS